MRKGGLIQQMIDGNHNPLIFYNYNLKHHSPSIYERQTTRISAANESIEYFFFRRTQSTQMNLYFYPS